MAATLFNCSAVLGDDIPAGRAVTSGGGGCELRRALGIWVELFGIAGRTQPDGGFPLYHVERRGPLRRRRARGRATSMVNTPASAPEPLVPAIRQPHPPSSPLMPEPPAPPAAWEPPAPLGPAPPAAEPVVAPPPAPLIVPPVPAAIPPPLPVAAPPPVPVGIPPPLPVGMIPPRSNAPRSGPPPMMN